MSAYQELADVRARMFDEIPSGVVLIDPSLTIVDHNRAFGDFFGECRGASCFTATRGRTTPCPSCPALDSFSDGRERVIEQTGNDSDGREDP